MKSKAWVKKVDTAKNWPLVKNLQFLSNLYETWPKLLSHWLIIQADFDGDWIKIVDFFTKGQFLAVSDFFLVRL